MGQIISAVGQDLDDVVGGITKLVTDVGTTVQQVTQLASSFVGAAPPVAAMAHAHVHTVEKFDDDQTLAANIKTAMTNSKTAVSKTFAAKFPNDATASVNIDNGIVNNFCGGGSGADVTPVIKQITNDFSNWAYGADKKAIQAMAQTISTQINAQMGATGTAYGTHNVDMNESIDWVVAYGEFQITTNTRGLIYAFGAVWNSGWSEKKKK
jgi:hypothetical protein